MANGPAVPDLAAPPELEVYCFDVDGDAYAIFAFPLRTALLPEVLSDAERDVVRGLFAGLSNAAIAARRGTSRHTVANQLRALYAKFGVFSRAELVAHLCRNPQAKIMGRARTAPVTPNRK